LSRKICRESAKKEVCVVTCEKYFQAGCNDDWVLFSGVFFRVDKYGGRFLYGEWELVFLA